MKWRSAFAAASFLAGLVAFAGPALPAKPQTVKAKLAVSLLGFTVARAELNTRLDDKTFALNGSFSSVGLAKMLGKTQGSISVAGGADKLRMQPKTYKLNYKTDEKDHRTAISFKSDSVVSANISPKPPVKDKSWVKLDDADLSAVNDPVTSMMFRANGPAHVCKRTIRIFDGIMRLDVRLSPAGRRDKLADGEVTCRVGFKPVSGYRSSRSALKYLRDESNILVSFSQLGRTGIYIPVHASVGTQVGTVVIKAESIKFDG